jgi:hypothetical protein
MSNKINFTIKTIDNLPPTEKRLTYYDTNTKGLALLLSPKGTKTFTTIKKVAKKVVFTNIGRYPNLTISQARKKQGKY